MCHVPPCVCVSPILCVGYKYNILQLTWLNMPAGTVKNWWRSPATIVWTHHATMLLVTLVNQSFQSAITKAADHLFKVASPAAASCNLGKGVHLPPGFFSWGSCDQMFLQQGLLSSVLSALVLFRDTALMEPRTISLLLAFLWISEAKKWIETMYKHKAKMGGSCSVS